ncbi:MAG: hypothetical protein KF852_13490 [Saprospiraceae bacterium]|nr:hypothetical protein [Saprospiraceae bacterium]
MKTRTQSLVLVFILPLATFLFSGGSFLSRSAALHPATFVKPVLDTLPPSLVEDCGAIAPPEAIAMMSSLRGAVQTYTQDFLTKSHLTMDIIPIQVHIIRRTDGTGGITLTQWETALGLLNTYYAGANLHFVECLPPNIIHSNTFFNLSASQESALHSQQGIYGSLNIYVPGSLTSSTGGGLCGYAYFPWSSGRPDLVMVSASCITNGSTLPHEVGHFFGLYHTHGKANCGVLTNELVNGSNCATAGDDVCDTPADPGLQGLNCDAFVVNTACVYTGTLTDANGQPFVPDPRNIMSYSRRNCRDYFSPEQSARISFYANNFRDYLFCNPTACNGTTTLTACSSTFSDGSGPDNYADNMNCRWVISPPDAVLVTLTFTEFDTRAEDFVYVYDGLNAEAPLLGAFSGSNNPGALTGASGSLFVQFITDGSGSRPGWSAHFNCTLPGACSEAVLNACNAIFSDGSGPDDYSADLDCSWLISPPGATGITLSFTAFDTEQGADWVRIYDGTNAGAPLLGEFSGNTLPNAVTGSSGSLLVRFTTNDSISGAGWQAGYTCTQPQPCTGGGVVLTNCTGTISDGIGNYDNNLNCRWLIAPPGATSITLTFTQMMVEAGFDFVRVYDGPNTSAPLLGTFSGAVIPGPITSSSGSLFVTFITDVSINGPGWSANYTCTVASDSFQIPLSEGWNLISSRVLPAPADLLQVLSPIAGQVVLLRDQDGQSAIPSQGFNEIGDWSLVRGYQVKANADTVLTLSGTSMDPSLIPMHFAAGWQTIGYLRMQPGSPQQALAGMLPLIEVVKNNEGEHYIPRFGINTIGQLRPTQGYRLKAAAAGIFFYPLDPQPPEDNEENTTSASTNPALQHFVLDDNFNTGHNSTVIFPADSLQHLQLQAGDEMGIFNTLGLLCGAAVFDGINFAVTAWGDDPTEPDLVQGLLPGEAFQIKLWRQADNTEQILAPLYSEGDGLYQDDAVAVISFLDIASATQQPAAAPRQLTVFPNPAGAFFTVRLPTGIQVMDVRDNKGRLLQRISGPGGELHPIDTAHFARGLIWIHAIDATGGRWLARVVLQ